MRKIDSSSLVLGFIERVLCLDQILIVKSGMRVSRIVYKIYDLQWNDFLSPR